MLETCECAADVFMCWQFSYDLWPIGHSHRVWAIKASCERYSGGNGPAIRDAVRSDTYLA